jgi:hypothetical protein
MWKESLSYKYAVALKGSFQEHLIKEGAFMNIWTIPT